MAVVGHASTRRVAAVAVRCAFRSSFLPCALSGELCLGEVFTLKMPPFLTSPAGLPFAPLVPSQAVPASHAHPWSHLRPQDRAAWHLHLNQCADAISSAKPSSGEACSPRWGYTTVPSTSLNSPSGPTVHTPFCPPHPASSPSHSPLAPKQSLPVRALPASWPRREARKGTTLAPLHQPRSFATASKSSKKVKATATETRSDLAPSPPPTLAPRIRLSAEQRYARLEAARKEIEKSYGAGTLVTLGAQQALLDVPVVSTGSIGLDAALGVGGLPQGRIIEIYGLEASGKTTLALHVIAEAQKQGGFCAFLDLENAFNEKLAQNIGVDLNRLEMAQTDDGESALGVVDQLIRSGSMDVIVVDSVSALRPRQELEGQIGDATMALQARLMSPSLRRITGSLGHRGPEGQNSTMVIFLNQVRQKIAMGWGGGMPIEYTSGGNALKFYASVRIHLKKKQQNLAGKEVRGTVVEAKVVKNKVAAPYRTARFDIDFGYGISREGEIIDLGEANGLIAKAGTWYSYEGTQLGQGKENAKQFLREHPEVSQAIADHIRRVHTPAGFNTESDAVEPEGVNLDTSDVSDVESVVE